MRKIFTTLTVAIVCLAFGMQAYAAETVYLKNTKNWAQPYVWAWNDSENCTQSGTWPGDAMTYNAESQLWEWTAPTGKVPTQLIFNPGGDNGKTGNLTFVHGATYDCDGNSDAPVTLTGVDLHGQLTGNSQWETVKLKENTDGNWEYTGTFNAGEFGIRLHDGNNNETWVGGGATITEADHAYNFTPGGNSKSELVGSYTFVYNPTDKTVTFIPYTGPIEVTVSYELRGTIGDGSNWADFPMTETDGIWSASIDVKPGEFGIKRLENGSQKGWFWGVGNNTISSTGTYNAGLEGTDTGSNWKNELTGKYDFQYNPETKILAVSLTTTGVEDILAEDGVREYYNLNGVKVAEENLTPGCYIVRCGNKVQKVFVR